MLYYYLILQQWQGDDTDLLILKKGDATNGISRTGQLSVSSDDTSSMK